MKKLRYPQNFFYTSPPSSQRSRNYYEFAHSEPETTTYQPDYKKLSERRKQYQKNTIEFHQLLNFIRLERLLSQKNRQPENKCNLCETTYSKREIFQLCQCEHKYCEHCLIQYINFKINSMDEIICPDENCTEKISLNSEIYLKLPQQLKKKYQKAQLWKQTIANPDLKLCPQQNCEGQVHMKMIPPQCGKCKRQYCQQCMMQKHQGSCDKTYQIHHKQWRRCPNCRIFIAKTEGCNHMKCICGQDFCFICLDIWSNSHYRCMQKALMYYFNMDDIKNPLFYIMAMISLSPFLVVGGVIILLLGFLIMIPIGAVIGIGYLLLKHYYLLCLLILLIPIAALAGALSFPFMFLIQKAFPEFVHHFRRYKITLDELLTKLKEESEK